MLELLWLTLYQTNLLALGHEENVYRELKKAALEIGHFTVFKKEELPDFWHFKNNERTPPIFVLADEKYGFQDMLRNVDYYAEKWGIKGIRACMNLFTF